jgi:hypothetical protein
MPSDFAPVRSSLAREREQGRSFAQAWKVTLETVEDPEARQVLGRRGRTATNGASPR